MNQPRLWFRTVLVLCAITPLGCGSQTDVDTTYGKIRGESINGTGAFAAILRQRGHDVRPAIRANDALMTWADVIVRFAPQPGQIDRQEGLWLANWLNARPFRQLIYIPNDFDSEFEFWEQMIAIQPAGTPPAKIKSLEKKRDAARNWASDLPSKAKHLADPATWFEFVPNPGSPAACKKLEGPWANGVDVKGAALPKHETFKVVGGEEVYLSGDGAPLAIGWTYANDSQVLILANASFLLNAPLMNKARRPLALHVIDWIDEDLDHVAFLEGRRVALSASDLADEAAQSQFHLLEVEPFGWIATHFLVFLFLLAFSVAARLGRPIPDPSSGVERSAAHPEALGALFAKTGRSDAARFLLESYRRWRHHNSIAGRPAPTSPPHR